MIPWIESQSVAVIIVVGYALCFAVAALIFAGAILVSRTRFADELQSVTPTLLTPLGVILGLLLAFLSSRVWTNVDRAQALVSQEASGSRELIRIADALPADIADPIRRGVNDYLLWVRDEDWPRMMSGHGSMRIRLPGLGETTNALAAFNTTESGQRALQQGALNAIEKIRDARRGRILLSKALIGPGQWLVVFVLFVHVLLLLAVLHIRRFIAIAFVLGMFASAFAICFVLLLIYDRPFRYGGLAVEPVGFEELISQ